MKNNKCFQSGAILCVVAAALTGTLLLILAKNLAIWPFGDIALTFWDGNWQYVDYLVYFRDVLLGERSLWYSLSTTLGNNMSAISGYYLLSPFNLLVLFFEKTEMPAAFTLICMCKIIACSACFQVFLNQFEETRTSTVSVVFSVIYALSGYVFIYGYNYMWLDGVMALPLVAAGIHRLITEGKSGLYLFGIAYGLITCYYVGYMLCIFSVLYFGVHWLFHREKKVLFQYVTASLLAGVISACVLLPEFFALGNTEAEQTAMQMSLEWNFNLKELCGTFFLKPFTESDLANDALPKLFCGAGSLYFAMAYFFSKTVEKTEKKQYAALLLIVLLSMCVNVFNLVWHGFSAPEGCPYRCSFVFTFLMLVCSARGCVHGIREKRTGYREMIWKVFPACLCVCMTILASFYGNIEFKYVAVSAGLIIVSAGLVLLQGKKLPAIFIMVVLLVDVFHCGKIVWIQTTRYEDSTIGTYREYVTTLSEKVADQYDPSEGLVRMELNEEIRRSYNDAIVYDFPGLSFYSSAEDTVVEEWLFNMGIANWREFYSNGTALDTILGIRYRIGESTLENVTAFPLIWSAEETAMYKEWQGINAAEELNRIFRAVGTDLKDVLESRDPVWNIENDAIWTAEILIQEPGDYAIVVDMTEDQERPYAKLYVDGERVGFYSGQYTPLYYHMEDCEPGETIRLEIQFEDEVTGCHWYRQDSEALAAVAEEVISQKNQLFKRENTFLMKLYGTVFSKENQDIVVSIPYHSGWKVTVDGEVCDTYRAFDVFLGIDAGPGVHTVEMTFYPPGLKTGMLISGLCVLCISVVGLYKGRRNKAGR